MMPEESHGNVGIKNELTKGEPVELMCVSERNLTKKLNRAKPKLWFSRTERMMVGIHSGDGVITKVRPVNVPKSLKSWAKAHEDGLGRLHALLHRLQVEASKSHVCMGVVKSANGLQTLDIFPLNEDHDHYTDIQLLFEK